MTIKQDKMKPLIQAKDSFQLFSLNFLGGKDTTPADLGVSGTVLDDACGTTQCNLMNPGITEVLPTAYVRNVFNML